MPEGVAGLLRDLIHEKTGIYFEDSRIESLMEKLEPLAQEKGFQSFLDYYYALKDHQALEWKQVWEALSVQETYFWREIAQIEALTDVVIPEWFQKHSTPFRIWCAASATGEEPYSIAIAIAEAGLTSHPIEITASDASLMALEKAKSATYRERSFRSLPTVLRQKYFVPSRHRLQTEFWHFVASQISLCQFSGVRRCGGIGARERYILP